MDILLSICIPTLNRAAFIGATLDSIIPQLSDDIEIVIVDGGSRDGTDAVVASRAALRPSIRYHRSQHITDGEPKPSNAGYDRDCDYCITVARGRYCWILPDDDFLVPDAIATVRRHLEAEPALVVANAQIRDHDVDKILLERLVTIQTDQSFESEDVDKLFTLVGQYLTYAGGVIVRRQYWLSRERALFYGSGFVHLGALFSEPTELNAVVIARPLVLIRYGNAQWTDRAFRLWMIELPKLIWAFRLGDAAKAALIPREPWKSAKQLLLYRGRGSYGMREYRLLLSEVGFAGRDRAAAWLIAATPAWSLNLAMLLYFRWRCGPESTAYFNLLHSPANPFRSRRAGGQHRWAIRSRAAGSAATQS
jgi:abequosyltransferase